MRKYTTRDGKVLRITIEPDSEDVDKLLCNTVPRLTYDEILDGALAARLEGCDISSIELSSGDFVKTLLFSNAMFNALSKPTGM